MSEAVKAGAVDDGLYRIASRIIPTVGEADSILANYCSGCRFSGGCVQTDLLRKISSTVSQFNIGDYFARFSLKPESVARKTAGDEGLRKVPDSFVTCRLFEPKTAEAES